MTATLASISKGPFESTRRAADAGLDEARERNSSEQPLASEMLLRGRRYVQIEHNGSTYQLRATKFGKLILTK